jgi:hypothetical protein
MKVKFSDTKNILWRKDILTKNADISRGGDPYQKDHFCVFVFFLLAFLE